MLLSDFLLSTTKPVKVTLDVKVYSSHKKAEILPGKCLLEWENTKANTFSIYQYFKVFFFFFMDLWLIL